MAKLLLPPYTSRTRVALSIARGLAAARGDTDVTTTHLALGLLREGQNLAVAALLHAAVPLGAVRQELEAALGPPPGRPRPDDVAVPLTPGEQGAVEQARTESRLLGNEYVGPEHLLLAILREQSSPAGQVFARHGFSSATAREHLDAASRGPESDGAV
jgi:ATP-dependent Clp protease ATP-binding subunit ClpC